MVFSEQCLVFGNTISGNNSNTSDKKEENNKEKKTNEKEAASEATCKDCAFCTVSKLCCDGGDALSNIGCQILAPMRGGSTTVMHIGP
uniref:Uncharacterized protein n=1 Tax=Caenorhabditis japonica TaxID=281687 RepID=A0A8R1E3Y4_CAEJA